MVSNFFLIFVLAHFIGDFVLQTNKLAQLKFNAVKGVLVHAGVVCTVQVLILATYGYKGIVAAFISGFAHFFIDYFKKQFKDYWKKKQFIYFVIDQVIHLGVITGLSFVFAGNSSVLEQYMSFVKLFIGLIVLLYVATVAAKIIVRDLFGNGEDAVSFMKRERILDAISMLILAFVWMLPIGINFIIVLLAFFLYRLYQKALFGYRIHILGVKYLIYSLTGYTVMLNLGGTYGF